MVFQCINVCQVPRELLKTSAFGLDFQHLPRDLANVNEWKTMFDPYNKNILFYHINIGIKHGFSCINVCQVPREVLKTEAEGRGFQHLPRDLANVNVLENHV